MIVMLRGKNAPVAIEVESVDYGAWSVHGVIRKDGTPHPDLFTVTHAPTGLAITKTEQLTRRMAHAVAWSLAREGDLNIRVEFVGGAGVKNTGEGEGLEIVKSVLMDLGVWLG